MFAAAACSASPTPVANAPQPLAAGDDPPAQVVVVVTPPSSSKPPAADRDQPAPPPPPADLLAGLPPPKFPEDNLDSYVGIGCGGGCPPAYVLETEHRDNKQIFARLKYCDQLAQRHIPNLTGTMSVRARIGADGKAKSVSVQASDGIPAVVSACVHGLVRTAVYSSKYHYERDAFGEHKLGEPQPED